MKDYLVEQVTDSPNSTLGILERHSADDSVDLVAELDQVFRQVAPRLPGYPGDKRPPAQFEPPNNLLVRLVRQPSVCRLRTLILFARRDKL